MTKTQLETRLDFIEGLMNKASAKDLPGLNATFQKLMDRLVALDLSGEEDDAPPELSGQSPRS
jgi:hypothetical protein